MRLHAIALPLIHALALAPPAAAEPPELGARAVVRGPVSATGSEDASSAATSIATEGRGLALEETADVLAQVPGAQVRDRGGVASFAGLSLRGAEVDHTGALLDTVPLGSVDAGAFDLSLLPLAALERIEVYRGAAPVWLGDGSIGGVVRLVPARARGPGLLRATFGAGSFGRLSWSGTSAVAGARAPRPAFLGHVSLLHADNDYAYVDDGQTRFDPDDDRVLRQKNGGVDQGSGLMQGSLDVPGGRLSLLLTGTGRSAGVPGPLARPTRHVHHQRLHTLGVLRFDHGPGEPPVGEAVAAPRLQLMAGGALQRDRLSDLYAELGTSRQVASDDLRLRRFARAAVQLPLLSHLDATAVGWLAHEDHEPSDPLAFTMPPRPSSRTTLALALEPRLHGRLLQMPFELRPSLRLEHGATRIRVDDAGGDLDLDQRQTLATYRVAGLLSPLRGLRLSASVASGRRLPTIAELFGDRMFREPNPELRAERSRAYDVSVVAERRIERVRGSLELRAFRLEIEDLIRYVRTSQLTVRPGNLASARVHGIEAGLWLAFAHHAALSASLTALDTESHVGRALPLRAPLMALVRPQVFLYPGFGRLMLFVQLQHRAFVYLDDSNRTFLPARTPIGAGAALDLLDGGATLELRAQDILDAGGSDLLSRPLPGRAVLLSLTVQERVR